MSKKVQIDIECRDNLCNGNKDSDKNICRYFEHLCNFDENLSIDLKDQLRYCSLFKSTLSVDYIPVEKKHIDSCFRRCDECIKREIIYG